MRVTPGIDSLSLFLAAGAMMALGLLLANAGAGVLTANGKGALFNAAGECSECCGGGPCATCCNCDQGNFRYDIVLPSTMDQFNGTYGGGIKTPTEGGCVISFENGPIAEIVFISDPYGMCHVGLTVRDMTGTDPAIFYPVIVEGGYANNVGPCPVMLTEEDLENPSPGWRTVEDVPFRDYKIQSLYLYCDT
jgi:hypothetical protein